MAHQRESDTPKNGSFLVLNLGTNTVGLANSLHFPSSSSSSSQKNATAQHPPSKPIPTTDSDSTSHSNSTTDADDGSSSPTARKRKDISDDDPDWVPSRKGRRSAITTACRASKPPPAAAATRPSGHSSGSGGGGGVASSMSNASSVVSSGEGSGAAATRSAPPLPPQYLVGLLNFFGWKVLFRQAFGDCVYISPAGVSYSSLPKAFEIFLHGTRATRPSHISLLEGTSMARAIHLGGSIEPTVGERGKNVVSTLSKNQSETLPPENGNETSQMHCMAAPQDKSGDKEKPCLQSGSLGAGHKETVRCSSLSVKKGRSVRARRLGRISKRCVAGGSEMGIARSNSNCSLVSECKGCPDESRIKEDGMPLISQDGKESGKVSANSKRDEGVNKEVANSDCSIMGVPKIVQSHGGNVIEKESKSVRVGKSRQINGKNESLGRKVAVDLSIKNSSCVSAESTKDTAVRQEKNESECLDGKINSRTNGEPMDGETKRSECSTTLFSRKTQAQMDSVQQSGTRRSMRINGKHVIVDNELVTDTMTNEKFVGFSEFATCNLEKKGKSRASFFFQVAKNTEDKGPQPNETAQKQTTIKQSDLLEKKVHSQLESNCFEKIDKEKKLRLEKCSSLLKDFRPEIPIAEKCPSSSTAKRKSFDGGKSHGKKKRRNGGCGLIIRRNGKDDHHEEIISQTKVSILSWLIDSETLSENEKVVYIRKDSTANLFSGSVTRLGIWCSCCKKVLPLLEFEAHAGSSLLQPWNNILCLSGKSLVQCLREAWEKEKKQRKIGFQTVGIDDPDPSDDTCGVCADGGHLICCDNCPSTFHQECVMLKDLPEGSWYCPYCRCAFCNHKSDRGSATSKLNACKQCGRKYHGECAWKNGTYGMNSVPVLFCGQSCIQLASQLSHLLGVANPIDEGFSWTLLKRFDEDDGVSSDQRLSFIMESNAKLSVALSVLNECFVPLVDQRTGVDMISQAVYNCGSNFNRLNYEGFYTVILGKDEEIITVASLRFHGTYLAEMPFIGTRPMYRKQGMCRRLLKAIEDMLSSLCIEKLVIPAIPDLLKTWTTSFSFKPLEPSHRAEIRNRSMMIFAETTLLQKLIYNAGPKKHGGGQDWWDRDELSIKKPPTSLNPRRMQEDTSTSDLFAILHPEVSIEKNSETLPFRNPPMQNRKDMHYFQSVKFDQDSSDVGSGTFSAEDLIEDSIRCGFPLDSFFRVRN